MAKALNSFISASSKLLTGGVVRMRPLVNLSNSACLHNFAKTHASRAHCTLSAAAAMSRCSDLSRSRSNCVLTNSSLKKQQAYFSTEVDKEISKFLEKEIQYETSKAGDSLPKIPGFDILTDGGDVTLTRTAGSEKVVVKLSVNGAVDSVISDQDPEKENEPPQMICRPPFEVEITKGDGTVLALQCSFPSSDEGFDDATQNQDAGEIDDQFEIQEVALHGGEWKDTTFTVSAATMDAELFDLLMDMLDERGVTDDFIAQLVDYCTAYENKQYINFLKDLKTFAEK